MKAIDPINRDSLTYRRKVAGIIIDNTDRFLVVQLTDYSSIHWNFVGGGIEKGEEPHQAIVREIIEELGTDKFEVVKQSNIIYKYDWPDHFVAKRQADGNNWRGQEVTNFLVKFLGSDDDIKPDPIEIRHYKWVDIKGLEESFVLPDQWSTVSAVIEDLFEEFKK